MSRRAARELALRALFMIWQARLPADDALEQARLSLPKGRSSDPAFVVLLVHGTAANQELVDEVIKPHIQKWAVEQLSAVDRTILRLATFEMLFTAEPVSAIIDEAVTLAKIYGTPESGRFVNGVLGAMVRSGSVERHRVQAPPSEPNDEAEPSLPIG